MNAPSIPDPNNAAIAGAKTSLANYPFEYIINQLAQLGSKGTVNGQTYDFTGLGNADNAAAQSDQTAAAQLQLQQLLGPQFARLALQQQELANPLGTAAEKQLGDLVMQPGPGASDTAKNLQEQIQKILDQGATLDTGPNSTTEAVQQGVRGGQIARGITLGNAPEGQEATALVNAGQAQRDQTQQAVEAYLAAGVSPQDVQYRQLQQQIGNLGNYWSGQTPLAQFGSVAAAQNGAAPWSPGYYNPAQMDPNAALAGINNANSIYGGQVNWNASQMNPYLAGLGMATSGLNVASGFGWNPYRRN